MARKSFPVKPASVVEHTTELSDWIEAISTFQTYYSHLSSYRMEGEYEQMVHQKKRGHDQCPMDQLNLLLNAMQTELVELIKDMDQVDSCKLSNTRESYDQLATHTQHLHQLNQRAQTMMQLTTLATL